MVLDAIVKKAPVVIIVARAVTPGKFLIIFTGSVAEAEEAYISAQESSQSYFVGGAFLPHAHEKLTSALCGNVGFVFASSVGVIELTTSSPVILAADAALKAANISVIKIELSKGIGGKSYFVINGETGDIDASITAARSAVRAEDFINFEIIHRMHGEIIGCF